MRKVLIDTNIYSGAMRGAPEIVDLLQSVSHIGISVISLGELLSGFRGGNRERENRRELNMFLDSPRVTLYYIDENTAEYYSEILNSLKNKGTPIPTNDIWIAATACRHGLRLHTLDKHFERVDGLFLG